jgi:hypothetical protein
MLPLAGDLRGHLRLPLARELQMATSGSAARAASRVGFLKVFERRKEKSSKGGRFRKGGLGPLRPEPPYFEELL